MAYVPPPKSLSLAQLPTPFHPLERLTKMLDGPKIWVKRDDLTGTPLTGNKIRKLQFVLQRAILMGADTVITCGGLQSNHCRATALAAAQLGLKCHLILRGERPRTWDGNTLLAALAGAQISYHTATEYSQNLPELFQYWSAHYDKNDHSVYCIPTGASDGVGLWGYYHAAAELKNDFLARNIKPELVCCATGSGGTHAGLALGFSHIGDSPIIRGYAVCDDQQYFLRKARQDIEQWYDLLNIETNKALPIIDVNDQYIGEGYGQANEHVFETIKLLARTEGIILDPVYTGKAFLGLLSQIRSGELRGMKNVVFIHTGGVFGLFPFRAEILSE